MVLSRAASLAPALALALGLVAWPAGAVAPPDSAQLRSLRDTFASGALIAVVQRGHEHLTRRPRADAEGVAVPLVQGRPALVTVGHVPSQERRIGWADIDGVQRVHPRVGLGFVAGVLLGAALTAAEVSVSGPDLSRDGDHGVLFLGAVFTGLTGAVGAWIGGSNPRREPLYP